MTNTWLSLRTNHPAGRSGLARALGGAVLASLIVLVISAAVSGLPGMAQVVLVFGINAVLVVGYQTFAGNTGIVSFGHVGFMGLGAYAGGIAAVPVADKELYFPDMPAFLASWDAGGVLPLLIGGLVAAVAALVTGPALMRLSGAAASIATLGLLVVINNVLSQATPITRGPQSFFGVPENTTFAMVFLSLCATVLLSAAYKWSREGRNARAVRDQPAAAAAAGVSIVRSRTVAFVISAFVTGIAGALYAQLLTAFSPGSFYLGQMVLIVAMAIVGGVNSVTGALVGAAVITVLNEVMRRLEGGVSVAGLTIDLPAGVAAAVLGAALIVTLKWRPEGFLGHRELILAGPVGRGPDIAAARPGQTEEESDAVPVVPAKP
ncbi:amino acid/amide ABC transporter membrane protein 2 (HAAT family) [Kribbella amoyensis]|uniref:Amino acid/amide ABC transporter membrane protein 2 (HAAT family) n=1 Tax=Kribbella amoyensis TaxID=996641 RepID=A0A561B8C1_9ACTN|nr:branched-chain amino acid ABC transporter permease [Kribbella amoyensis]TWD75090.1 amino acid/amide ABC transporter membrane protein 2 (HAAT family) [Kribbella amoyensis]